MFVVFVPGCFRSVAFFFFGKHLCALPFTLLLDHVLCKQVLCVAVAHHTPAIRRRERLDHADTFKSRSKANTWCGHRFELQVVVAWILEKHSPLLTRGAFKAQMRLNNEIHTLVAQVISKAVEVIHRETHTEVRDRNLVSICAVAPWE